MDSQQFDKFVQALGQGASRRGVLGLLAGLAGVGVSGAEARRRKRARSAAQKEKAGKTTICHHDREENEWHPITVSDNALDAHKKHGDFAFDVDKGECCTNPDCPEGEECVIVVDTEGTGSGTCEPVDICEPGADACGPTAGRECGTDQSGTPCYCATTTNEEGGCFLGDPNNCDRDECSEDRECRSGERCVQTEGCCGDKQAICIPRCNEEPGCPEGQVAVGEQCLLENGETCEPLPLCGPDGANCECASGRCNRNGVCIGCVNNTQCAQAFGTGYTCTGDAESPGICQAPSV